MLALAALLIAAVAEPQRLPPPDSDAELRSEVTLLRERIEELERLVEDREGASPVEQAAFYEASRWSSRRRYPTLQWSGFTQLDAGWVSQSQDSIAAVGDIDSQAGLRRVRLRVGGNLQEDVSYLVDLDFAASGHPSFRDVKFTAHDQGWLQNLHVGYYQQPFGFDAMTSGRELLLLERQLPFAFVPFRQTGLGAFGMAFDENVSWSLSGFRYPTDPFGVSEGDNGGWGYSHRVTVLPYYNEEKSILAHIGGSFCFIDPGDDVLRYAIEPGFFVVDPADQAAATSIPAFVDTGNIPTENVNLAGVELASQWGSINVQAEAIGSFVNPTSGPSPGFYGVSTKLAYVLTGETHPYDRERGVFTRIEPTRPASLSDPLGGAWEMVAAWSIIDLDDADIRGGQMQTIILGLNRYVNRHVKAQINVIRVLLDDPDTGASASTLAAVRAQVEF